MSNNKKSSVDWLVKEFHISSDSPLVIQAKAMHREEIIKAAYSNMNAVEEDPMDEAENYYNETFGGE
jgi:hypothetical protein